MNKCQKKFNFSFIISLIFLILISGLINLSQVQAKPGLLSLSPAITEFLVAPGEGAIGQSIITNQLDQSIRLKVITQDFRVIDKEGHIEFFIKEEASMSQWIVPQLLEFNLSPGQSKEINFIISVPEDTTIGDHYGAIVFESVEGFPQLKEKLAILVLLTVKGEGLKKEGRLIKFDAPRVNQSDLIDFNILFKNTGLIHLSPEMTLLISNLSDEEISRASLKKQIVYANSTRKFQAAWQPPDESFSIYKAKIILPSSGSEELEKSIWFIIFPWKTTLYILLIIIAFLSGRYYKEILKKLSILFTRIQ